MAAVLAVVASPATPALASAGNPVISHTTLSLAPTTISFGAHSTNSVTNRTLTVTNTGSIPWELTNLSSDNAAFTVPGGTCFATVALTPGSSCVFTVSFRPTTTGPAAGTLTLTSNFPVQSVPVAGTGLTSAPIVTALAPRSGPAADGTRVTITGSNFVGVSSITIGAAALRKVSCTSQSTCPGVTPPGHKVHDIRVHTATGVSAATPADRFTYIG